MRMAVDAPTALRRSGDPDPRCGQSHGTIRDCTAGLNPTPAGLNLSRSVSEYVHRQRFVVNFDDDWAVLQGMSEAL